MLKPTNPPTDEVPMDVIYKFPPVDRMPKSEDGPKKRRDGMVFLSSLLVIMIIGLFLGWSFSDDLDEGSSMTVGDIRSMIIETATHRPDNPIHPNGGVLGSWWIYATESVGDSLLGLCLESRTSHIGASRASMRIDVEDNTLSFVLENAVIAVLPDGQTEGSLDHYASIEIGPIPLTVDVTLNDTVGEPEWQEADVANAGSSTLAGF